MINIDFFIDPLTGLKNLFGLIEDDISNVCGEEGVIIAIDIARFEKINSENGREIGDICIKNLAQLITSMLCSEEFNCTNCSAFRVGGDEFTLILPRTNRRSAENLVNNLVLSFKEEMLQNHDLLVALHTSVIPYDEHIDSVSMLLKLVNSSLGNNSTEILPRWADALIDNILLKTKETLSLLRHANKLALSDEISGLPNHRAAEIHLFKHIENYSDTGKPFSVLFIDGDNLRQYNELGYQRGNKLIADLGKLISASLRRDDLVFRWFSGDEFLVILAGAEREDALRLGERIRCFIEEGTKEYPFPVTVSIGVSCCPEDGLTISEIIGKAESANCRSKRTGKNRVS